MILSRWTCDVCFVTIWAAQGVTLSECVRCGGSWRKVRDDRFDDLCTCKRPKVPRQTKFATEFLTPMLVTEAKTGSGAKRLKAKTRRPAKRKPPQPEAAPATMNLSLRLGGSL